MKEELNQKQQEIQTLNESLKGKDKEIKGHKKKSRILRLRMMGWKMILQNIENL
eukprot:UN01377